MEIIEELLTNRILICGLVSWAVAQVLKVLINAFISREFDIKRLFGDGGMPSGHSATVCAVAVSCGLQEGFGSTIFAVAAILAIVVMHDATGVRRETGKQAVVLNDLLEVLKDNDLHIPIDEKLKIFVGHTPLQVFFGAFLGILIALGAFCLI